MSKKEKSVYSKEIDWVEKRLRPELSEKFPKAKRAVATFLVLAANWGQGDAFAGLSLRAFPKEALERLGRLVVTMGGKKLRVGLITGMNDAPSWGVLNLDAMADAFVVEEAAERVKVGRFW